MNNQCVKTEGWGVNEGVGMSKVTREGGRKGRRINAIKVKRENWKEAERHGKIDDAWVSSMMWCCRIAVQIRLVRSGFRWKILRVLFHMAKINRPRMQQWWGRLTPMWRCILRRVSKWHWECTSHFEDKLCSSQWPLKLNFLIKKEKVPGWAKGTLGTPWLFQFLS